MTIGERTVNAVDNVLKAKTKKQYVKARNEYRTVLREYDKLRGDV